MSNAAAHAFIAFLRCEAQQAEDRAKSLRSTAAAIQSNTAPREAQRTKRLKRGPLTAGSNNTSNASSKVQSAYSLFVRENFELMQKDNEAMPAREIMSILDRNWASTSQEEKQIWRYRAEQAGNEPFPTIPGLPELEGALDNDDESEPEDAGGTRKARSSRRDTATASISV